MPIKNHSKVELSDNYLNLVLIETNYMQKNNNYEDEKYNKN
jgi:hypothetical protein